MTPLDRDVIFDLGQELLRAAIQDPDEEDQRAIIRSTVNELVRLRSIGLGDNRTISVHQQVLRPMRGRACAI